MIKKALAERIATAIHNDPGCIVALSQLETTKGFDVEYAQFIGLKKGDLKKLERLGMAKRGMFKREYTGTIKGFEYNTRWILIKAEEAPSDGGQGV